MEDIQKDKFKAVWFSHSSISDFLKCPRLYYLRNVYKDIRTNHKIAITSPPLALGQAVHSVIESLSEIPTEVRFSVSPLIKFEEEWKKVSGEIGGFENPDIENEYKKKGTDMIQKIITDPGILMNKAIKLKSDNGLSSYWFSDENNIILCGKVDWIEYLPATDSVHIIDFKSGKYEEDEDSLQLPIYFLLAKNLQKRSIEKASYWYLNNDKGLVEKKLPDEKDAIEKISKIADRISLARKLNHFKCESNGCKHCYPYERILKGEGKWVGVDDYKHDIYVMKKPLHL
jgi:ATP-dependent helicase/DNAse subunit B